MMNTDQMKLLTERLEQIQKVCNRIDRDLEHDRHELQEVTLRLGAMEGEVRQLKDNITRMPNKVADRVDDAIKPVTKEANDLKKAIEKKVRSITINRSWFKFWK